MINVDNVSFKYKNQTHLLFNKLNFSCKAGQVYGLLGKNNSGKTTLLKLMSGLLFPKDGDCVVLDLEPKNRQPQLLADIYYLPEAFELPDLTIGEYKKFYAAFYPKFQASSFEFYLKEFNLDKSEKLCSLSYGSKKKFLIAFGLATNCRVMLFDEPTNGLDIPSKIVFRKLLISCVEKDRVIIVSTHQVKDLENIIDSVLILDEGKILLQESLNKVSQTLSILTVSNISADEMIFYQEKTLDGYKVVVQNRTGVESIIDLETLFNVVVSNPSISQMLFKKERNHE